VKVRTFPDLPLVVVEWTDAAGDSEADARIEDAASLEKFGGTMHTFEPGWLVSINGVKVVLALYKWPEEKRIGHSNTIPLAMVESVKGVDGAVYYERKRRKAAQKGVA